MWRSKVWSEPCVANIMCTFFTSVLMEINPRADPPMCSEKVGTVFMSVTCNCMAWSHEGHQRCCCSPGCWLNRWRNTPEGAQLWNCSFYRAGSRRECCTFISPLFSGLNMERRRRRRGGCCFIFMTTAEVVTGLDRHPVCYLKSHVEGGGGRGGAFFFFCFDLHWRSCIAHLDNLPHLCFSRTVWSLLSNSTCQNLIFFSILSSRNLMTIF